MDPMDLLYGTGDEEDYGLDTSLFDATDPTTADIPTDYASQLASIPSVRAAAYPQQDDTTDITGYGGAGGALSLEQKLATVVGGALPLILAAARGKDIGSAASGASSGVTTGLKLFGEQNKRAQDLNVLGLKNKLQLQSKILDKVSANKEFDRRHEQARTEKASDYGQQRTDKEADMRTQLDNAMKLTRERVHLATEAKGPDEVADPSIITALNNNAENLEQLTGQKFGRIEPGMKLEQAQALEKSLSGARVVPMQGQRIEEQRAKNEILGVRNIQNPTNEMGGAVFTPDNRKRIEQLNSVAPKVLNAATTLERELTKKNPDPAIVNQTFGRLVLEQKNADNLGAAFTITEQELVEDIIGVVPDKYDSATILEQFRRGLLQGQDYKANIRRYINTFATNYISDLNAQGAEIDPDAWKRKDGGKEFLTRLVHTPSGHRELSASMNEPKADVQNYILPNGQRVDEDYLLSTPINGKYLKPDIIQRLVGEGKLKRAP